MKWHKTEDKKPKVAPVPVKGREDMFAKVWLRDKTDGWIPGFFQRYPGGKERFVYYRPPAGWMNPFVGHEGEWVEISPKKWAYRDD